jgi:hypothetical protein
LGSVSRRALGLSAVAGLLLAVACGIRGSPRPANPPPVNPSSMDAQQTYGRDSISRSPIESSRGPAEPAPPPPRSKLPTTLDGGTRLDPFRP